MYHKPTSTALSLKGVIEESLLLEATGDLNVTEDVDNSSLNIDGELSVFYFQYHDVDGERVLQHTQFEAMADFVLIDDGTPFGCLTGWIHIA